jgi:catechol 2,3-dioxygenase-like lactoylglutathione lyase family enzyme
MSVHVPCVRGIGGIFFTSPDPEALAAWYRRHLGFDIGEWGGARFPWQKPVDVAVAYTVWSPFKQDTTYLQPSNKPYMLNLLVNDLDGLLDGLRRQGVPLLERREDGEFGKFGYVLDPDGTLLELWQPSDPHPTPTDLARDVEPEAGD